MTVSKKESQIELKNAKFKISLANRQIKTDHTIIDGPGEYDLQGLEINCSVKGVFLIRNGWLSLGWFIEKPKNSAEFEVLETTHIVLFDFDQANFDHKEAAEIIKQIEPTSVIVAGQGASQFCQERSSCREVKNSVKLDTSSNQETLDIIWLK